jgi:hypothetical protein
VLVRVCKEEGGGGEAGHTAHREGSRLWGDRRHTEVCEHVHTQPSDGGRDQTARAGPEKQAGRQRGVLTCKGRAVHIMTRTTQGRHRPGGTHHRYQLG